jgi:hypothetical protein
MDSTQPFDVVGGEHRALTDAEAEFLASAAFTDAQGFGLDVWLHSDSNGPWLIVSYDLVVDGELREVLRVDFDGSEACGGVSPQHLNGDDGVRARSAGVDLGSIDALRPVRGSPPELGGLVREWFRQQIEAFYGRR